MDVDRDQWIADFFSRSLPVAPGRRDLWQPAPTLLAGEAGAHGVCCASASRSTRPVVFRVRGHAGNKTGMKKAAVHRGQRLFH